MPSSWVRSMRSMRRRSRRQEEVASAPVDDRRRRDAPGGAAGVVASEEVRVRPTARAQRGERQAALEAQMHRPRGLRAGAGSPRSLTVRIGRLMCKHMSAPRQRPLRRVVQSSAPQNKQSERGPLRCIILFCKTNRLDGRRSTMTDMPSRHEPFERAPHGRSTRRCLRQA